MAKFTYTPTEKEDAHEPTTVFGIEFIPGEPVEVTSKTAIAKLAGHPQFEAADAKAKAASADAQTA